MDCYLSQVRFPHNKKLYWFQSDGRPGSNTQRIAWVNGKATSGTVVSSVRMGYKQSAATIAGRPFSSLAPLIAYAKPDHHDGALSHIDTIRAPGHFQATMPHPRKIAEKYQRIAYESQSLPLVVEKSTNILRDGYASFPVCHMPGKSLVPVVCVPPRK